MSERYADIDQRIEERFGPLTQKLKQIGAGLDDFTSKGTERLREIMDRLEEVESRASTPLNHRSGETAESREHKSAFLNWLRHPHDSAAKNAWANLNPTSRKDVTIGSNAGGGFAVPEEISRQIENLEKKLSPVRDLVRVVTAYTSDFKHC